VKRLDGGQTDGCQGDNDGNLDTIAETNVEEQKWTSMSAVVGGQLFAKAEPFDADISRRIIC